ncbi:MAG: DUF502 domain-containing protein [Deltaproteobacteria bacterium]|jgi:uncharacterized membrane protein|nr:DUF502 domain-containing protein [Deltaproteobacteria bacterium]
MDRIKTFIKTSILGGLAVILPTVLLVLLFRWLFRWITGIIQPLTNLLISRGQFQEIIADILAIAIILVICFVVGVVVKTRAGRFIQENLERRVLQLAPGYPTIKSVVMQFIGKERSPFSSVALVRPFENKTLLTAFITDVHEDGRYTVFVPTGPNPTSGFIFHLQPELVHPVNVPVEEVIKSVIACGMGSKILLKQDTLRT